jgi:hypothetical protein
MGSLDASGVPVVPKRRLSIISYGRDVAITSGTAPHGAASTKLANVQGVPPYARTAAAFGDQSTPAVDSFLKLAGLVKHAESEGDTTVAKISGGVPASGSPTNGELRAAHTQDRVVINRMDTDQVVDRKLNTSERPGG